VVCSPPIRKEAIVHDHRRLGRELDLFDTDPLIGAGLPYWLPAGAAVRHAIEEYVHEAERRAGYQHVHTPVLGKRELYELSGHWAHFRDDMFPPLELGAEQLVLRPSLCPHHALVFRSRHHSHRELPLRIAELGGMYRAELSGVLGGLTRVRAIQLNDAHVFCALDQVADEVGLVLDMIDEAYVDLGIQAARHRLSLRGRGGKYVADSDVWDRAESILAAVLRARGCRMTPRWARARSTGRRSTSRSSTRRAGRRPCRPCSSTSTSRAVSACVTSAQTRRSTGR
jgi:threonyl-tRNA synthetase